MNLIDLLTGNAGAQVAQQAENRYGVEKNQMIALAAVAAPLIISYLQKKSRENPSEAEALNNALEKDHDGSIISNPAQAAERQEEGSSILSHIFGSKKSEVENQLAQQTGISQNQIGALLAMLAPVIMGYIGQQKRQNNVGAGGIGDLLGGILSNTAAQAGSANPLNNILTSVLSGQQGGNNPFGEILAGLGGAPQQKQSGLGGLFGGLFK